MVVDDLTRLPLFFLRAKTLFSVCFIFSLRQNNDGKLPAAEPEWNWKRHVHAVDHSIRVQHRDYLEDKGLPQALCYWVTTAQELKCALHDPAGIGFTGMDAASQHDVGPVTCTDQRHQLAVAGKVKVNDFDGHMITSGRCVPCVAWSHANVWNCGSNNRHKQR